MLHPVCLHSLQLCRFMCVLSVRVRSMPAICLVHGISHSIPTTTLRHTAKAARQGGAEINRQASELTLSLAHTNSPYEMRHKAFADSFGLSR